MAHFDITPDNHDAVVTRLATMVLSASDAIVDEGLAWYDEAHGAARELSSDLGITLRQAAGVIATSSPNLDAGINMAAARIIDGTEQRLYEKSRQRALMCLRHDPTEIIDKRTAPKTWSFFWNIYAPGLRDHVTVDGRHADIIANTMRGWKANRGIDVGHVGSRYESYEFITEDTARALRLLRPFRTITAPQVQAILWCEGKRIERQGLTSRGNPRKVGCHRKGQPYVPERREP